MTSIVRQPTSKNASGFVKTVEMPIGSIRYSLTRQPYRCSKIKLLHIGRRASRVHEFQSQNIRTSVISGAPSRLMERLFVTFGTIKLWMVISAGGYSEQGFSVKQKPRLVNGGGFSRTMIRSIQQRQQRNFWQKMFRLV